MWTTAAGTKAGSGAKPVEWVRPQGQEAGLAEPVSGNPVLSWVREQSRAASPCARARPHP